MKINVIALEGSGRNWAQSLLRQHPDLEIWGESFPCFSWPQRYYPTPKSGADAVVVIVRDKTCQEASANRRGFNAGYSEDEFTPEKNLDEVSKLVTTYKEMNTPVHFFDYEAALIYRNLYLDSFFKCLGVKPVVVESDWRDENHKNFKVA